MFELSRTADYGVRAVLHVAVHSGDGLCLAADIAEAEDIPPDYVPKVLRGLVRAGLLRSHRGKTGGFSLARRPEDISLLDVIQALEGYPVLNRCLLRPGECPRDKRCPVHRVWLKARDTFLDYLRGATIASLLAETVK